MSLGNLAIRAPLTHWCSPGRPLPALPLRCPPARRPRPPPSSVPGWVTVNAGDHPVQRASKVPPGSGAKLLKLH